MNVGETDSVGPSSASSTMAMSEICRAVCDLARLDAVEPRPQLRQLPGEEVAVVIGAGQRRLAVRLVQLQQEALHGPGSAADLGLMHIEVLQLGERGQILHVAVDVCAAQQEDLQLAEAAEPAHVALDLQALVQVEVLQVDKVPIADGGDGCPQRPGLSQ